MLVNIDKGDKFSKIDLAHAYQQLCVDKSKSLVTINTHLGLYTYNNQVCYGIKTAPGEFQRIMDQLFGNIKGTGVFFFLMIYLHISGKTDEEHLEN